MPRIHPPLRSLALFTVLVFAGCSGGGGPLANNPADTVERFTRAVESGEMDAALDMLILTGDAAPLMDRQKMERALQATAVEFVQKGGVESIEVLSEEIDGDTATLSVRTTFGNGEYDEEDVELVQIDGRWIITEEVDF